MAANTAALAADILDKVGGASNISSLAHCATRLRLKLHDETVANKTAIEALPGVITVMQAGGQFQVVIGNTVPDVYKELVRIAHLDDKDEPTEDKPKGNLLARFVDLISGIIHPVLWTLAGAGLFKAFLAMFTTFGWLGQTSTTYTIWNAASDGLFYFLPVLLAVTAARHFKANEFTAMAIAAALVYPDVVAWADDGVTSVTFLGIPVVITNYTSSLIPIIVAVWVQGHLERALSRVLPATIKNFTVPFVVLVIMAPLVLITIGPLTTYAANAVSSGLQFLFQTAPWAGGAIMGAFWQVFVMFGLHWALVPVMLNDLSAIGYTLLSGPVLPAVLAQGAAMLGVLVRTRSRRLKQVAGPAAVSALLSGITEPGIYGVNLPKRRPFLFGCIGGLVGGILAAIGGSASNTFVFPSFIGIPAYMAVGNFALLMIACAVAMAIAFGLTVALGFPDQADDEAPAAEEATPEAAGVTTPATSAVATAVGTRTVGAPVAGRLMALAEVPDKVFASGAMGDGVGILPSDGKIYAPCDGRLEVAMDSGHAYGITSPDGVEVLVHVGIDTVQLGGQHFTKHVAAGQDITAGQLLAEVDLAAVEAAGYSTITVVVITNSADLGAITPAETGTISVGQPALTVAD